VRRAGPQLCVQLQFMRCFGARVTAAALQRSRWARREASALQPAVMTSLKAWRCLLLRCRRARVQPHEESQTRGWLHLLLMLCLPRHGGREPRG
jgi:hypothetical protein